MEEKKIPKNVINPFSEKFADETWSMWKMHRWEIDKFKYKGVISEQVALKHLLDLSDGDEEKARKIVFQSIERQWSGFYPLRQTSYGKSSTKKSAESTKSLREQAADEFMRRNAGGGQSADGSHLKAV